MTLVGKYMYLRTCMCILTDNIFMYCYADNHVYCTYTYHILEHMQCSLKHSLDVATQELKVGMEAKCGKSSNAVLIYML